MHSSIYKPAEDSYLLSRILKEKITDKDIKVLEIGAGSGIHLQTLENLGIPKGNIFSSDINPDAVSHCNLLGFNCIHSDLFQKIKGKYNLIIFNPPYLPADSREPCDSQTATTGGKSGCEIINKFLHQAKNFLKENGEIFLITSSLTKEIDFSNYKFKLLGKEKLFMEEIYVWELGIN